MKKIKTWTLIQILLAGLQLIAQALATVVVLQLNMLPGDYVIVFILAMVFLLEYTCLFMFIKVKGKIALWRRIVSCILAFLITCGCCVVSKVGLDTHSFIGNVTGGTTDTRSTYVLVRNEDTAQSLADTKDYLYGAVEDYDVEHTQLMIAEVEKESKKPIVITYYGQASALVDALYRGDVDALIMNDVSLSLLEEEADYQDILTRVRILHTLSHQVESKPDDNLEKPEIAKEPFIVYISGSDSYSQKLGVGRSDVNILAVVNPATKQILLLNTPRDFYIPNPAGKDKLDKLTHCGNYGIENSIKALEGLYDVQVSNYGRINFYGFKKLIDAIGGITVVSDHAFTAVSGEYYKAGENTLNGEKALAFARERHNVKGGDNGRGKNQMKVIKAVIDKMTSSTTLISKYADILKSLEGMFITDFTTDEISGLVKMQLDDMSGWNVQSFAVSGKGDSQETYSAPGLKLSVTWPNEDVVAYAQGLIQKVMDGETITAEDMVMPK